MKILSKAHSCANPFARVVAQTSCQIIPLCNTILQHGKRGIRIGIGLLHKWLVYARGIFGERALLAPLRGPGSQASDFRLAGVGDRDLFVV